MKINTNSPRRAAVLFRTVMALLVVLSFFNASPALAAYVPGLPDLTITAVTVTAMDGVTPITEIDAEQQFKVNITIDNVGGDDYELVPITDEIYLDVYVGPALLEPTDEDPQGCNPSGPWSFTETTLLMSDDPAITRSVVVSVPNSQAGSIELYTYVDVNCSVDETTTVAPAIGAEEINNSYGPIPFTVNGLDPDVSVTIGNTLQGTYPMTSDTSMVQSYPVVGGPVVIQSNNGARIIASLLQLRRPGTTGGWTGITQLMGVQQSLLSDTYVLPRYNGADSSLYNSIQVANMDTINTNVTITIAGTLMGTYPLNTGASINQVYTGTVGGPVVIQSDNGAKIIASLYELKRAGTSGLWTGQNQMMGVPQTRLSDTYVFPRYNDTLQDLDAFLIFANADSTSTSVTVTIGGVLQGTYPMNANTSQVVSYPVVGGPVVIQSNNGAKIVASLLQLRRPGTTGGWTGITQFMGLQQTLISDSYVLPRYNGGDSSLYNSVQVANFDTVSTNVRITIAGTLMGTYPLASGASLNQVYSGAVGGPIEVSSDNGAKIVVSLYELKRAGTSGLWTGQTQMMGIPFEQLSGSYVFPRYNDTLLDLDAYLIFAVP